ncbi:hypothetical protein ACOSP7_031827 [Xanthoceras sorbifolium]
MVEEEFTKYELEGLLELERELEEEENRNCNDLCIEKPSLGSENGGEEGPEAEEPRTLPKWSRTTILILTRHLSERIVAFVFSFKNSHTVHEKPSQLLSRTTYSLHPHAFIALQNSSNKVTTGDMPYT